MPRSDVNVFVNMPFEDRGKYRNLLVAYVAGLAGLGFRARTVLEIRPNVNRLQRLLDMLAMCGSSIHDLSCIRASAGCPRFNMPFELGLAVASSKSPWFVFEEAPYRLQRTLSDVNGHDPFIHDGDGEKAVIQLRQIFVNRRRQPSVRELLHLFGDVRKLADVLQRQHTTLLGRQSFQDLVAAATTAAERRGLI